MSDDLCRVFEQEVAARLQRLRAQRNLLVVDRPTTAHELRREAHTIKGAAAVVGRRDMCELAGALEEEVTTGSPRLERIDDLLDALTSRLADHTLHRSRVQDEIADAPVTTELVVLHVDDDETSRTLVQRILARRRIRPLAAANGKEGLALARQAQPDLILLDLNLPDARGEDLLRELRGHAETRGARVIVMSGETDEALRRSLLDLGADGYLPKPFRIDDLLAFVDD